MKKSEMEIRNLKTAQVQRIFRWRHKECVFNASTLIVQFEKKDKRRKNPELIARCDKCLIERAYDTGEWIN